MRAKVMPKFALKLCALLDCITDYVFLCFQFFHGCFDDWINLSTSWKRVLFRAPHHLQWKNLPWTGCPNRNSGEPAVFYAEYPCENNVPVTFHHCFMNVCCLLRCWLTAPLPWTLSGHLCHDTKAANEHSVQKLYVYAQTYRNWIEPVCLLNLDTWRPERAQKLDLVGSSHRRSSVHTVARWLPTTLTFTTRAATGYVTRTHTHTLAHAPKLTNQRARYNWKRTVHEDLPRKPTTNPSVANYKGVFNPVAYFISAPSS